MFKPRFAICIDGGFLQKVLCVRDGKFPDAAAVVAECDRIRAHEALADCDLLRIYYYDAPAAQGQLANPISGETIDLQDTDRTRSAMRLQADLQSAPNLALRMGEVRVGGWRLKEAAFQSMSKAPRPMAAQDLAPNLRQKGVDIRIGLDIARLALNDTVRSLVVVTADTDFVPAFKFARREGIRVYLDTLGRPVLPALVEHSDLRISPIPSPAEVRRERQRKQRQRRRERKAAANDAEPTPEGVDDVAAQPAARKPAKSV